MRARRAGPSGARSPGERPVSRESKLIAGVYKVVGRETP
jgi:hypothetical protein